MTAPADVLRGMFEHHLWATGRLLEHLGTLSEGELDAAIPGTYGGILATLTHLIDADGRYLLRLEQPILPPYEDRGEVLLADLRRDLDDHAHRWSQALARLETGTLEAQIAAHEDYPEVPRAEGLLLAQAIHHGDDHRTQICSTLGALGLEVPDLDVWTFWASERSA